VTGTSGLEWSADGAIGRITLARPEKLNALNRAVLEGLAEAAVWFDARPEVKVVIIAGEGRSFSAGMDLADRSWAELGPPEMSAAVGRAMAEAISGMAAVTICAVQGHCVGGGVVLAAACDLRIAADDARFRIPEIDLGVPLYWLGIPLLTRELGPALTKELVLTGRPFDAAEAKAIRFVNHVVPLAALASKVHELAAVIAAKSALVVHTTKRQVDEAAVPVPSTVGDVDVDLRDFARSLADPESREVASRYRQPGR
jgi:enoyl-CoA hydratase/carnithine racemase